MTIINIAKYPQAKYKNISFNYQNSSVDGGRKTVTHEFPDSNTRYVEDLGLLEKRYNIDALIDINSSNSPLTRFLKVLDEEGIGSLTHPIYGSKKVVVKNYNVNDTIKELGVVRVNIVFEEAQRNKFPEQDSGNIGLIGRLKKSVDNATDGNLSNAWSSVKQNLEKFNNANQAVKDASREIKRVAAIVEGAGDGFTDFVTSINEVIDSAGALVQAPSNLASKLRTAFDNLGNAYSSSQNVFNAAKGLFGFSSGSENVPSGTSSNSIAIRANQALLNNYVQASALGLAYENAVLIDYTNVNQLDLVRADLENGFDAIPDDIDRDVYDSLINIRTQANIYFDNISINLARVSNFYTNPNSLNILTYSIYGNLDNKQTIKDLNSLRDTSNVSGTIKILSNA